MEATMNFAHSRCGRGFERGPGARACRVRMPSQAGMSLVEIMVALAIGLFLVLIATTIYMQGLKSFGFRVRSEEHTSELQSQSNLVCRLLLEKKKKIRFTSL